MGITLEDGTEYMAERVISAADGRNTLFTMLEARYGNEKTREPYEKWPLFPSLIFVSLGVNRTFEDIPRTVSGLTFHLKQPVEIGDAIRDKLSVHIYKQDPTLAPAGKTAITPENANVLMKPMAQSLPDLKNFYMCGHWVEPGGGLPTAIMSGRRLVKKICKEDRRKFTTD